MSCTGFCLDKGKLNKCMSKTSVDTVSGWTQWYAGNSNLLDQLYFGHLSCFTISSIKYAKVWNKKAKFILWSIKMIILEKTALKLDEK
jgi:hypothetical protein